MVNAAVFARMKRGVRVLTAPAADHQRSRSAQALDSGQVAGAAGLRCETEPLPKDSPSARIRAS
jgi:phosphoglycerate dehydrogenase-like enzyme